MIRGRLQGRLARRGRDKPADSYPDNPWALLLSLGVLGAGIVFASLGRWRMASLLIGGDLLVAALLRLALPRMSSGLLVVRRRWIDVAVLTTLGVGVVILAFVVPASPN